MAGIEQSNETPIPVENGTDLLIALLYAPGKTAHEGEPITGATRLQKLFFLLREGEGPKRLVEQAQEMGFQPYKMGPFSTALRDTVTELEAADILKTERLSYVIPDDRDAASSDDLGDVRSQEMSSVRYVLTDSFGLRVGRALWASLDKDQQQDLTAFKRFFNGLSLRQLLIFTYEKYPQYTTHSTIRGQLGF